MRILLHSALAVLMVVWTATAHASTRYDPRLRFQTISTERFDIHFHKGEEAVAARLAGFIEEAAASVDAAIGPPDGRVQVILVDQHDLSNGWATPLPYNTIELSAAAPSAASAIGNTDDWLRLVFVHEYTHIAHLSRAGGWIAGLRRPFGRNPALFPNLYQPLWGIEGIATWQESAATGQGRVHAGDSELLIGEAARAGRFEPIDRAAGGNVDWPSGAIPYLYGGQFHEYLAERYGRESIRRLADETAAQLPFLASRAYRKVFGRPLGELWSEFRAAWRERARDARDGEVSRATRLTHHGFTVSGPRYDSHGRIFYSIRNPHEFPALMVLETAGGSRRVADRYLGSRIGISGNELVIDEVDLIENVALQSDLYAVDSRNGSKRRLTRGARALDPDVSRGGRIVTAIQMSDRRALATVSLPSRTGEATPDILISEAGDSFGSPSWSPDGSGIAAERRRLGGRSDIVLVDPDGRTVRVMASLPGGRAASPAWTPDGRHILFAASVQRQPFRIFRVDVATGAISRLEGTGASAEAAAVSPDGRTLVFVGYTAEGYDLFSISLDGAQWTAIQSAPAGMQAPPAADGGAVANAAPYTPWRTLAPTFWTPSVESDAGELVLGAATGGVDALGRHAYGVQAGWSRRGRPDWQASYAYDRWWPTLFVSAADDTDPWRDGNVRTVELNTGVLLRRSQIRFSHAGLAALHAARDTFECPSCTSPARGTARFVSVRGGYEFSNARAFGYSISAEEGGLLSLAVDVPRRAFGSHGDATSVTFDARRYLRLAPRHGVLAMRVAGAASWGDHQALQLFSAAGSGPQPAGFGFGVDAIGLLRGFDEDEVLGTRALTLNVDYRVPLARPNRGAGTIPLFIRSLHAAVFVDAGHAWTGRADWRDARFSAGGELSTDTVIGFGLPVTFTAGGAWRRDGGSGARGFAAFVRIGRAF